MHKISTGEVELVEHLEIMHVSYLSNILAEYFSFQPSGNLDHWQMSQQPAFWPDISLEYFCRIFILNIPIEYCFWIFLLYIVIEYICCMCSFYLHKLPIHHFILKTSPFTARLHARQFYTIRGKTSKHTHMEKICAWPLHRIQKNWRGLVSLWRCSCAPSWIGMLILS